MSQFAEQLIAARKAKNMTQEQLAQAVHISRSGVSRWENGSAMPNLEMLFALSEVLECNFLRQLDSSQQEAAVAPQAPQAEDAAAPAPVPLWRKRWLWAAAAAGIVIAAVLLMVFLPSRKQPFVLPADAYSKAWYQQPDVQKAGQAFVTVTAAENPTKAMRTENFEDGVGWFYSFRLEEHNGVDFTIEKITQTVFNLRGQDNHVFEGEELAAVGKNITLRKKMPLPADWGGGFPLQNVSGVGLAVEGTDAHGNHLIFRGYVELSPEIAE